MKKYLLVITLLLSLVGAPLAALASDISGALYYGTIVVSNNSTATTNVATTANISTTNLINGNYINTDADNCVVRSSSGADVKFMPGYTPDGYPWSMWIPSIGDYAHVNYILYTAESTGGEIRYFPGTGGMTTVDDASLELSDNFTIEQTGWLNTDSGTDKNLVYKEAAFRTYVSPTVSENITSEILDPDYLDYVSANSDFSTVPDSADFSFTDGAGNDDPFTVIDWVRMDAATGELISKFTSAGNLREWRFYRVLDQLRLELFHFDDATKSVGRRTDANLGTYNGIWTHIAGAYDGSETDGGINLYINGVDVDTTNTGVGAYTGMTNTAAKLNFGMRDAADYYDGGMAEAKIYDVEFTPAQILADFNGTHTGAGLMGYWPIDEGAGLPQDSSGHGNHFDSNIADWATGYPYRVEVSVTAPDIASAEHTVVTDRKSPFLGIAVDQGTDFLPIRDGLPFNAPLWQPEEYAAPAGTFDTIDSVVHTCTVTGAVWSNQGYDFVFATGDVIACGNDASIQMDASDWSIEVWANADLLDGVNHVLVSVAGQYQLKTTVNNKIQFSVPGVLAATEDTTVLSTDTWYHIVVVYDQTANEVFYYIDGSLKTSPAFAQEGGGVGLLYIGRDAAVGTFDGTIGETRIYSQALTPAEVLQNYNATKFKYTSGDIGTYSTLISVPNNANDWTFHQNDVMIYMESQEITIDGVQQQYIDWEYGATFYDTSHPAPHFDGTATSNINAGAIHDASAKLWVDLWFMLDSNYAAGGTHQYLFGKILNPGADFLTVYLSSADGRLSFVKYTGGGADFSLKTGPVSYNAGQWYHIKASISSTEGARFIFNNGAPITNTDTSAVCNGGDFIIGDSDDPGAGTGFVGIIANFSIGTDDLTTTEEAALYAGTIPADAVNIWYADEGTGTNIIDYGTGGNDGTADAAVTWADGDSTMPNSMDRNNATPTFRGASSDADVTAELTAFLPIAEAQAPDYALGTAPPFIDADALTSNITGTFTTTPGTGTGTFPLAGVIKTIADASGTPSQLPLLIVAGFIIIAASLSFSAVVRPHGSGTVLVKIIVIVAFMGIFMALGNFGIDFWMLFIFISISVAVAFASRQLGWT